MSKKKVDVKVITHEGVKVAVELALSTEALEYDQALKDLSAGYDKVIIVCLDKDSIKKVKKTCPDNIDEKITVCLLWQLIQCDLKEIYEFKELVFTETK